MASPRLIRIFLASPGDVSVERKLALNIIDRLPYDPLLRGKVIVEAVAWDKPGVGTPMLATLTPQAAIDQGIPKPSECDIFVAIFWSRFGTSLPEDWIKPEEFRFDTGTDYDNRRYLSGTEWEYVDAMQAATETGLPFVLVYRRTEKLSLSLDDPDFEHKRRQWRHVEAFFKSFNNPDGSIRQGYNAYDTPDAFREQLEVHLRSLVGRLLESPAVPPLPPIPPEQSISLPDEPLWHGSPFPGLRAFMPDDAPIFFGRGRETDALLKQVEDSRFVAVVGASGSGKSSLVGAGLIPRLLDNGIPGSKDWLWRRFTPGEVSDNPFVALAIQLAPLTGKLPRDITGQLTTDPNALRAICERALEDQPAWAELVLFVDQFEELFTVVSPEYRAPFVDLLAVAAKSERLRALLTLRADFFQRCVEYSKLAELLQARTFPLAAPEIFSMFEMITRPAQRAGLTFEADLTERILSDAGDEPGALALLAFTLDELYQVSRDGTLLTHAAYDELGGIWGAIGNRAEGVFSTLDSQAQSSFSRVFPELVEIDEQGEARRRISSSASVKKTEAETRLVDTLTQARLLVQWYSREEQSSVEVAHEALFRSWDRLARWIDETSDELRLMHQIRQAAREWEQRGHSPDYLWFGNRLREAQELVERLQSGMDETVQEFLNSTPETQAFHARDEIEVLYQPTQYTIRLRPVFGVQRLERQHRADIFMLMPFSEELPPIYDEYLKPVINGMGLSVKRADDFFSRNTIIGDIWNGICATRVVIADCTTRNPNVFYELGIAHTLGKPTIMITCQDRFESRQNDQVESPQNKRSKCWSATTPVMRTTRGQAGQGTRPLDASHEGDNSGREY